jgi:hypothetical protein
MFTNALKASRILQCSRALPVASVNVFLRAVSYERAGKALKPGNAIVLNDHPNKVVKITQGKRGKGGAYVR